MKRTVIIFLLFLLACTQGFSQANSQKKAKLEREIAILDQQIKDNAGKARNANTALKLTRKKIGNRKSLVAESDARIAELDTQIREQKRILDSLQERFSQLEDNYTKLVRTAYRNRDTRIWYMYLFASEDITQGLRRYGYLKKGKGNHRNPRENQ